MACFLGGAEMPVFYRNFNTASGDLLLRLARVESDVMVLGGWLNKRPLDVVEAERLWHSNRLHREVFATA